MDAANSAIPY